MTSKSENEVPLYCSDEESEGEGQPSKKKRGECKNWIFMSKFSTVSAANEAVSAENMWAVRTTQLYQPINRVIKDHNTLRERIPLARFLVVAEKMVTSWSQATDETFATQPELQLCDWTTGYQWAKTDTKIRVVQSTPDSNTYLIPGKDSPKNNQAEKKFKHFDEYKKVFFSFWKVTLPNNQTDWITGCCDCPDFYRKYICKHLIGLAIRLKFVMPPLEAKAQPLGLKRKRGRPTKARAALIIQ